MWLYLLAMSLQKHQAAKTIKLTVLSLTEVCQDMKSSEAALKST
jgi:hypothetical protein